MNLAIVNSTMLVVEGEGMAEICISIDVAVEPTITVSINAMSGSATGKSLHMTVIMCMVRGRHMQTTQVNNLQCYVHRLTND